MYQLLLTNTACAFTEIGRNIRCWINTKAWVSQSNLILLHVSSWQILNHCINQCIADSCIFKSLFVGVVIEHTIAIRKVSAQLK